MTYDYDGRMAWVDDLAAAPPPAGCDLCTPHAGSFSVPQGWTRSDRRTTGAGVRADDDAPVAAS
jgi:hypothetical protein